MCIECPGFPRENPQICERAGIDSYGKNYKTALISFLKEQYVFEF